MDLISSKMSGAAYNRVVRQGIGAPFSRSAAALFALLCLELSAQACDSCKLAIAASNRGFSDGMNDSIYFMLTVTYSLPLVFGGLVFFVHRSNRRRERAGEGFRPEGKIRWDARRIE